MNDDNFNMSIRKFLKTVGVRSQHEIEKAVAVGMADGKLKGYEKFPAQMTLKVDGLELTVHFDGEISLE